MEITRDNWELEIEVMVKIVDRCRDMHPSVADAAMDRISELKAQFGNRTITGIPSRRRDDSRGSGR